MEKLTMELGGRELSLETGKVAKQANGAVVVQYGDTVVLVTTVTDKREAEGLSFFPLTVEYREKSYAVGRIPGGFFKREGRPKENEVLSARLIDRPIRPLFPKGYQRETQVFCTILSSDQENNADIVGLVGASAALSISDIPFDGPVAAVRVGIIDDEFVLNPTFSQLEESTVDLVVAGSDKGIVMVEGGAREISEERLVEALSFAQKPLADLVNLQRTLVEKVGKEKITFTPILPPEDLKDRVETLADERLREALQLTDRDQRRNALSEVKEYVLGELEEEFPESESFIAGIMHDMERDIVREQILMRGVRLDGRAPDVVRPITCEIGFLPRTHGSALFTRGQTQSLGTVTLGTKMDEQKIEDLVGESWKSYMLHYNFPAYSVGEVRPFRGPGRREIGHGALAERALEPTMPSEETFPYTVRIVSDILESNGSSSMATVCSGSLALMDAGVPVRAPVAGVAMGMIKDDGALAILTDILGDEDHLGDMDLKVAGTRDGITACQMDLKISGIALGEIADALSRAKDARLQILNTMAEAIEGPREHLSPFAPRITIIKVDTSKIGGIIGPGGKTIRQITEETGAKIDIDDDGTVLIAAVDGECSSKAVEWIESLIQEPEVGETYTGKVKRITNFGAYVEILPGKDGLVHISQLEHHRVNKVEDVLQEGDTVTVKCIGIDDLGRVDLSRKALLPRPEGFEEQRGNGDRDRGRSRPRGRRRPER
jgi:polyribonucleotide nucleotidyltransferase